MTAAIIGQLPLSELEQEVDVFKYEAEVIPSLTALLMDQGQITHLIMLPETAENWSLGHILAAAKILRSKRGALIYFGTDKTPAAMITPAKDLPALQKLLQAAQEDQRLPAYATPARNKEIQAIRPLGRIPNDLVLTLAVCGTQQRIGCTTQAIQLWHYCKTLGFAPAVVVAPDQLKLLKELMSGAETPAGVQIEGVLFTDQKDGPYDCNILDMGPLETQKADPECDWLLLVAGVKPWELPYTALAAQRLENWSHASVVYSFAGSNDVAELRSLFPKLRQAAAAWVPDMWKPQIVMQAKHDKLLRHPLEALTRQRLPGTENERR